MKIVVYDEAGEELSAAAAWYEQEREGLGDDLLAEADRVLGAIAASPATWPFVLGNRVARRLLFTRFPYAAYYVGADAVAVEKETVEVQAGIP
ncbi:MAG: type II toxin-antitoxin system RelE/ParE family toxin [Minicystis sp.]